MTPFTLRSVYPKCYHLLQHYITIQVIFIICFHSCMYLYADFHLPKSHEFKRAIILSLNILPNSSNCLALNQRKHTPLCPRAFKTQTKEVCLVCFTASLNGDKCIGFKEPEALQSSKMTK